MNYLTGRIESFEITIVIRLLFTGSECEKGAVGMVPADIGDTESQGLEPDCILPTVFTLWFFRHGYGILESFADTSFWPNGLTKEPSGGDAGFGQ